MIIVVDISLVIPPIANWQSDVRYDN